MFGLPYQPNPFAVDLQTLKQRFREAQTICHPDAWASKGSNKEDVAQALSARINEAYQSLLKPLARVEYILDRNGRPISETDSVDDPVFFAEVMQVMEDIDEAEEEQALEQISKLNDENIRQVLGDLEDLVSKQDWEKVKDAAVRLKYLDRISQSVQKQLNGLR